MDMGKLTWMKAMMKSSLRLNQQITLTSFYTHTRTKSIPNHRHNFTYTFLLWSSLLHLLSLLSLCPPLPTQPHICNLRHLRSHHLIQLQHTHIHRHTNQTTMWRASTNKALALQQCTFLPKHAATRRVLSKVGLCVCMSPLPPRIPFVSPPYHHSPLPTTHNNKPHKAAPSPPSSPWPSHHHLNPPNIIATTTTLLLHHHHPCLLLYHHHHPNLPPPPRLLAPWDRGARRRDGHRGGCHTPDQIRPLHD